MRHRQHFLATVTAVCIAAIAIAAPTYTAVEAHLDSIRGDIISAGNGYARAASTVTAADNVLAALPTTYAATIAEINAQAAANPNDAAWQMAASRLAKMATEFQALKAKTAAAKAAFASIETHGAAAVAAKLGEL